MNRAALLVVLALAGCSRIKQRSFELPNGLHIKLMATGRGDTAGVAVLYQVGSDDDPAGRSGMTHLLANLLKTAAPSWEVRSGRDFTVQLRQIPVAQLPAVLDQVAARMANFDLQEAQVAQARTAVLEEMAKARGGDPALAAGNYASEAILPSPGGGWRGGIPEELGHIAAWEAKAFWDSFYKPVNARVVVVGHFDPDAVQAQLTTAFAKIPEGQRPVARPPVDSRVAGTLVMGSAPSVLALAVAAPPPADARYPAFLLLAGRLEGPPDAARKWQAAFSPLERPDVLLVRAALGPNERPEAVATLIRRELAPLLAVAPARGDRAAVLRLYGQDVGLVRLTAADCRADPQRIALAEGRRAQLGIDGKALAQRLERVTPEELSEAAKLFAPDRSAAVAAGGELSNR